MIGESKPVPLKTRGSDLPVRLASAAGMIVVAGGALWSGGWIWTVFVGLISIGLLYEWQGLVRAFTNTLGSRLIWLAVGVGYIGVAASLLAILRFDGLYDSQGRLFVLLLMVSGVIATDVGAYFAGRVIGGPKIAPKISPSKTWAGLGGGIVAACVVVLLFNISEAMFFSVYCDALHCPEPSWAERFDWIYWPEATIYAAIGGALIAIVAQAGDFFESWMKRRAGVKDSGRLLPGHGGLLDRLDGLLAVAFVPGLIILISRIWVE